MGNREGKSNRALGPTGRGARHASPRVIRQYERDRAERNRAGH